MLLWKFRHNIVVFMELLSLVSPFEIWLNYAYVQKNTFVKSSLNLSFTTHKSIQQKRSDTKDTKFRFYWANLQR